FGVAYSYRFINEVFFHGEPKGPPKFPPHKPPRYMIVPVEILVALCLLVGIVPNVTVAPFLQAASTAVLGYGAEAYHIGIWHGFTLPLLMSMVALAGGLLLYSQRKGLFAFYERRYRRDRKIIFESRVQAGVRLAQLVTDGLEN